MVQHSKRYIVCLIDNFELSGMDSTTANSALPKAPGEYVLNIAIPLNYGLNLNRWNVIGTPSAMRKRCASF